MHGECELGGDSGHGEASINTKDTEKSRRSNRLRKRFNRCKGKEEIHDVYNEHEFWHRAGSIFQVQSEHESKGNF